MKGHARQLLMLRHAKAGGERGGEDDFYRPLTSRGEKDALVAGQAILGRGWMPDLILCSPARRTRSTLELVLEVLERDEEGLVRYEEALYNASFETLLRFVQKCPLKVSRLMIVGHNPGLDHLLEWIAAAPPPRKDNGKLMTTAALACLETDAAWPDLAEGGARLVELIRP
ncbi:MAG: histidine phosphatase family protein [Gammaproteobacteria bacterium]|nr:histidine phosphatase family protein [Gammaproteobacteria bacterium]